MWFTICFDHQFLCGSYPKTMGENFQSGVGEEDTMSIRLTIFRITDVLPTMVCLMLFRQT